MLLKTSLLILIGTFTTIQAATVTATSTQVSGNVNSTFAVDFTVSNVSSLYGFQFDITFNPGILSAQTVIEEGYFSTNGTSFIPGTIDNTNGTIVFIADSLSGSSTGFSGTTLLATATFKGVNSGSTQVTASNLLFLDSSLGDIAVTSVPVQISVQGSMSPTPEISTTSLVTLGLAMIFGATYFRTALVFIAKQIQQLREPLAFVTLTFGPVQLVDDLLNGPCHKRGRSKVEYSAAQTHSR